MNKKKNYLSNREVMDKYSITEEKIRKKFKEWLSDPDNLINLAEALNSNLHKRIRYWPEDDEFRISSTVSGNWEDQPETANQYIEIYRTDHHWDYPYEDTISNLDYILNVEREYMKDLYGDYFTSEFDEYRELIEKANPHIRKDGWKEAYEKLNEDEKFWKKLARNDVQAQFVVDEDINGIDELADYIIPKSYSIWKDYIHE